MLVSWSSDHIWLRPTELGEDIYITDLKQKITFLFFNKTYYLWYNYLPYVLVSYIFGNLLRMCVEHKLVFQLEAVNMIQYEKLYLN